MLKVFGIPNCDQVKKSQKWLNNRGIEFKFHDYKKLGITKKQLSEWCNEVKWETLLNKRSRTWKELSEEELSQTDRSNLTKTKAITLMHQHPTLIKRPVIQTNKTMTVGFDEKLFNQHYT
ncbi:MAG: arsenate reductase [Gammaproteobacteria bacterium]